MSDFLDVFVEEVKKTGRLVFYAKVLQDDKILGSWTRFSSLVGNGLSAFNGMTRMESFSLSKSVTAIGAGIAIDEGLITLDERVADSFPEWTWDVTDPEVLAITVEDLLKMASGMAVPIFFRDSEERRRVKDWGRYIYTNGEYGSRRGQDFVYNNVNPYLISCLIEKKYGANLLEYLRYRLLEPLDIANPDMTQCPMGHTIAANGMDINCGELLRFGHMVLNGGVYNGKRLVSESFVKAAISPQIKTEAVPMWPSPQEKLDYGYYFWVDSANQCSYMMGSLGQLVLILPEKNAVVSVQSMEPDTAAVADLVWEKIVKRL